MPSECTLLRFAWWLQYHNVEGGRNSIRNFISSACEWNSSLGYEDPRKTEKYIYDRFRREADKHLEVYGGPKAKLRLSIEMLQAVVRLIDVTNLESLGDAMIYSVLTAQSARRAQSGHPSTVQHRPHVLNELYLIYVVITMTFDREMSMEN